VNLGLVFFMENPLYRSKSYFSGRNLTKFRQREREKKKEDHAHPESPEKKTTLHVHTHTQHFFFNENKKKQRKPTKKGEKKPTYPKIYTKILSKSTGLQSVCTRRGEEEDGRVDPGASSSSRSLFRSSLLLLIL
jgi:hypothetical protein